MITDKELEDLLSMPWKGEQVPQRWFTRKEVIALLKKVTGEKHVPAVEESPEPGVRHV